MVGAVAEGSAALVVLSCAATQAKRHESTARRNILGRQPFSRRVRVVMVNGSARENMDGWQGKGRDGPRTKRRSYLSSVSDVLRGVVWQRLSMPQDCRRCRRQGQYMPYRFAEFTCQCAWLSAGHRGKGRREPTSTRNSTVVCGKSESEDRICSERESSHGDFDP